MKRFCIFLTITLILIIIFSGFSIVIARGDIDPNAYKNILTIDDTSEYSDILTVANRVIGILQIVAAAVMIIMLIMVAIKYFTTSVAEKASIKQSIMGYVIGAIILFGVSGILGIIRMMITEFSNL